MSPVYTFIFALLSLCVCVSAAGVEHTTPKINCEAFNSCEECSAVADVCIWYDCPKNSKSDPKCGGVKAVMAMKCSDPVKLYAKCPVDPTVDPTATAPPATTTDGGTGAPATEAEEEANSTPEPDTTATPGPEVTTTETIAVVNSSLTNNNETATKDETGAPNPFSVSSFIGGIVLMAGIIVIIFFGYKFYTARNKNYHSI